MFELLGADLPIRRRLWLMALVLFAEGSLSSGSLRLPKEPLDLSIQFFLFFGYVSVIAIGILLVTALPARLIKQSIIRRQKGADRYLILASRHSSSTGRARVQHSACRR